jgi:hypothetical protein
MKIIQYMLIGAGIIPFVTGCVSSPVALAPVGPKAGGQVAAGAKGHLQVFSATEKSPAIASDDPTYFDLHTGYEIEDTSGKHLKYVANHMSNMDEWPDTVSLAEGAYTIEAEAAGYGTVMVTVVIAKGRTTTVHLDRNWQPPYGASTNTLVFLPDGEAVGWSTATAKAN